MNPWPLLASCVLAGGAAVNLWTAARLGRERAALRARAGGSFVRLPIGASSVTAVVSVVFRVDGPAAVGVMTPHLGGDDDQPTEHEDDAMNRAWVAQAAEVLGSARHGW